MGGVSTPTMHESPGALEDSGVHTITNSMHTNDLLYSLLRHGGHIFGGGRCISNVYA